MRSIAVAICLVVGLVGCEGGDNEGPEEQLTPAEEPEEQLTPAEEAEEEPEEEEEEEEESEE